MNPVTSMPHVFRARSDATHRWERIVFWLFRCVTYFVLSCGAAILAHIAFKGAGTVFQAAPPFINTTFLTEAPESLYIFEWQGRKIEMGDREFRAFKAANPAAASVEAESYVYSAGGILPCIVGTVLLVVGSMAIALSLGVCAAIYLNEYATDGPFIRFLRLAILNLAGVPSIVFGLFGFGMFVIFFGWNVSLLAGWFTLAFMVLPVVITASEESLKSIPMGFREGSLALGATKWQTIRNNVLPFALPGILTSSILGIARVAGETAPIMFTAAYVVRDRLPWDVENAGDFFFQGVMALPYHIYVVSSKIPQNEYTERVQYGTAFVFLALVTLIAAASIILRNHLRARYKW
jgi:phosphate transport system permease protein